MKKLLLLALLTVCVGTVGAEVPDEENSTVEPWDTNGCVFVSPSCVTSSLVDTVRITVRNADGDPIVGSDVQIVLDDCTDLCFCTPDGLVGISGPGGVITLDPEVGGCDECTVIVRASGVTIATYTPPGPGRPTVRSTDWNGSACDGNVTGADFAFFADAFKSTQDECADYNCDGAVTGTDFSIFATAFKAGDGGEPCCIPPM
jgi:hypothetical protein